MELLPLDKRSDDSMARAYLLSVGPGDPLEPHEDGQVILLRGIEYGVREPEKPAGGGWACRLEDLGKTEPPWRKPISPVWNLGWKPSDWEGKPAIAPVPHRGDPRDPEVVAGRIFEMWASGERPWEG